MLQSAIVDLASSFLEEYTIPAAIRGGAEGSMTLLGDPAGGPGSLLSCGWYGRLNYIKFCGGINCIKFCGGINALMILVDCSLKGVCL